jgi:hypothetical protein
VSGIGAQKFNLTSAWQRFTATVAIPSIAGKTLGSNGDDFLEFTFWLDAGSTFNSRSASLGQQSGTFDLALVQIEEGSTDTAFEFRPPVVEMALCERYLREVQVNALTSGFVQDYSFPKMRAIPSATSSGAWSGSPAFIATSNGNLRQNAYVATPGGGFTTLSAEL